MRTALVAGAAGGIVRALCEETLRSTGSAPSAGSTPGGYVYSTPMSTESLTYTVPGMSCGHCRAAIIEEVEQVAGVTAVDVDLDAKRVTVAGTELDDDAVRGAIDEAGYEVA